MQLGAQIDATPLLRSARTLLTVRNFLDGRAMTGTSSVNGQSVQKQSPDEAFTALCATLSAQEVRRLAMIQRPPDMLSEDNVRRNSREHMSSTGQPSLSDIGEDDTSLGPPRALGFYPYVSQFAIKSLGFHTKNLSTLC